MAWLPAGRCCRIGRELRGSADAGDVEAVDDTFGFGGKRRVALQDEGVVARDHVLHLAVGELGQPGVSAPRIGFFRQKKKCFQETITRTVFKKAPGENTCGRDADKQPNQFISKKNRQTGLYLLQGKIVLQTYDIYCPRGTGHQPKRRLYKTSKSNNRSNRSPWNDDYKDP